MLILRPEKIKFHIVAESENMIKFGLFFRRYIRKRKIMKNIIVSFTNKAIFAAFVVLGAASAGAELVKTPILQTFEGEAEPVSVGYTVTGLGDFKNEVAVVFTNHIILSVPSLKYVSFVL